MPLRLMLDSGAFSVWKSGKTIDLDEYIKYCQARSEISLCVGLDVIPPRGMKLTDSLKDSVAEEGWKNYLKMIRKIPMEKVVPVYHRGDNIKWLEKFVDFGCPYIGISPRFDGAQASRRHKFLSDCKKVLLDSSGKCIVKTHGFAVTNHKMMSMFPFYSVDSATWTQIAAWGAIMVPPLINGKWNFVQKPYRVFCSVVSSNRQQAEFHVLAMKEQRPRLFEVLNRWLTENGTCLGTHSIVDANGSKPKKIVEKWADRAKTKILHVEDIGVCNSDQVRRWINTIYYHRANDALKIEHLYLAGNGPCVQVEEQIRYRLRSFVEGPLTTDHIYRMMGWYKKPFAFPTEPLNFSMKAPKEALCE